MKLLKVLGLTFIPFFALSLTSCGSRDLFEVQIVNEEAWNDTFNTDLLINGREASEGVTAIRGITGIIQYEIDRPTDGLEFNYGAYGTEGNAARTATANAIQSLLNYPTLHNVFEETQRYLGWQLDDVVVRVAREDNRFAVRSVVFIELRDANPYFNADITGDVNIPRVADSRAAMIVTGDALTTAINDAIALRTLEFTFRQTANINIVIDFVLNHINGLLEDANDGEDNRYELEDEDRLTSDNLGGTLTVDHLDGEIDWVNIAFVASTN